MNKTVYAVRIWASTVDIKMVSDEIGHSSLMMTEKYADFEISELRHDFPTLLNEPKRSIFGNRDTLLGDTDKVQGLHVQQYQ